MSGTKNELSAVEVVRAYCDAWLAGDTMALLSRYRQDFTLVWPGRHRFAGTHSGLQASVDALLGLDAETNRVPVEVVDVLEGSRRVAVVVVERWSRDRDDAEPEVLEHTRVLEFTVQDAQLRTCQVYESAQREIDDWLGASDTSSEEDQRKLLAT